MNQIIRVFNGRGVEIGVLIQNVNEVEVPEIEDLVKGQVVLVVIVDQMEKTMKKNEENKTEEEWSQDYKGEDCSSKDMRRRT